MKLGKPVLKTVTLYNDMVHNAYFLSQNDKGENWFKVSTKIYRQVSRKTIFTIAPITHFFLDHLHLKFD